MGLWQLAQMSSVLNTPLRSVYPEGTDAIMRLDFNRIFFPVQYDEETSNEALIVMWTGLTKGSLPIHFVPLLTRRNKYDIDIFDHLC